MTYYKVFISVFLLVLIAVCSNAQRDKKFFRKDYRYIEATQTFYKIHTIHKKWADAQTVCATEGATMFYPDDQAEADAVRDFWNQTQPFSWVYIGVSALIAKGVYETIDGLPITDVYCNWGPGEPNDADGVEDCVILRKDGTLNDVNCENKYPFVCKKTLASLQWNSFCSMPNMDYVYEESLGRCYKFHLDPKTWQEAYAACSAEQSYLAIINSQEEADALVRIAQNAQTANVTGDFLRGAIHLGFHKRPQGWMTIKGIKLEESGYNRWGTNQPDNDSGIENCGTMFLNGQLNDLTCARKCFFICEHDVETLAGLFDDRFGT